MRVTNEQAVEIERLAREYVERHVVSIAHEEGARRKLWASRPVKAEYHSVKDAVRAAASFPRHSDKFVEEYVDELLQAALDEPDALAAHVRGLSEQVEHEIETRLYVPLDGILIDEEDLRIGAVRLVRMTDDAFEKLVVEPFAHIMAINPNYGDTDAAAWVEGHRQRLQPLRGRACVEITTDLDLDSSFEQAAAIVGDVCDFLQTCIAPSVNRDPRNPIRWSTGVLQAWRVSFGASDGPQPRSNSHSELAFGGHSPTIGSDTLEKLRESGILGLGAELGRESATEYGALLRRAVRWFAKGERELHPDDRKLAYVTAVDLFFQRPPDLPNDGRRVVQRFCEGVGFALADEIVGVSAVARSIYGFYVSRNETSHAGSVDVETDASVDRLRWTILEFMSTMADRQFTTKADIAAWIEGRIAGFSKADRDRLTQASDWEVVEKDLALERAIGRLRKEHPAAAGFWRERWVLSHLLIDGARSYDFLVQLRPLAKNLDVVLANAAKRGDHSTKPALKALKKLTWVKEGYDSQLASGFT